MKTLILSLVCVFPLLLTSKGEELADPVTLFSPILVPAIRGFETSKTEKVLRGFLFRGDSFPGIKEAMPSEYGLFLSVTVHDEWPDPKFRDKTESEHGITSRRVTLPQTSAEDFSLEIEFVYGKKANPGVVAATDALINKLVKPYMSPTGGKPSSQSAEPWGPIAVERWRDVPCVRDAVATRDDVEAGRAAFYLEDPEKIGAEFSDIGLPHCAIFTDEHKQRVPVVIIQSERAGDKHYLGYRYLDGGSGIGMRSEFDLLDGPNELFRSQDK